VRRRERAVELELPGSPEEVWEAIATGPGITRWFAPSEVEERAGGAVAFHLAPGVDCAGVVTRFEPHRCFGYEEANWMAGAPPLATEFVIEARSGSACVVRVVTSLFASTDDWDDEIASITEGWLPMLRILRLALAHFRGQPGACVRIFGSSREPEDRAFDALLDALGIRASTAGARVSASPDVPPLSGTVESLTASDILLLTDRPVPGVALFAAHRSAGQVHIEVTLRAYGDHAPGLSEHEPAWRRWVGAHFPARIE
jgi:uncharacterized protein YndB with AHSA1/START domain